MRLPRALLILLFALLTGCGPFVLGSGAAGLLSKGDVVDPTSPELTLSAKEPGTSVVLISPAIVNFKVRDESLGGQPAPTSEPLIFIITPNKESVNIEAFLHEGGDLGAAVCALDGDRPLPVTSIDGSLSVSVSITSAELPREGLWTLVAEGVDSQARRVCATFVFEVDRISPAIAPIVTRVEARNAGEVLMEWLPSIEPGVVGYRLYEARGGTQIPDERTAAGTYPPGVPLEVPGGVMATSIELVELQGTRAYYFQLVAIDKAGNESALSPAAEVRVRTRSGGTGRFGTPVGDGQVRGEAFPVEPGDATMTRIAVADLDGDRRPDYVIGAANAIYVVSGAGVRMSTLTPGLSSYLFRVGDVTDDRLPDIVVVSSDAGNPQNLIYKGRGDGTFEAASNGPAASSAATDLVLADLDDDGLGGLVTFVDTGDGTLQELHWFRDLQSSAPEKIILQPFIANEGSHFIVADVDGDGTKDLIGGIEQNILIRRGGILPVTTPAAFELRGDAVEGFAGAGGAVLSVEAIDLNGDGRRDFVCALDDGRVSVIENLGMSGEDTILLSTARLFLVGTGRVKTATGDFNADGLPDIAAAEPGRGVVTVLLSRRGGALSYHVSQIFSVSALVDLAVVDHNRDGLLDLAVLKGAGEIEFWFGQGSVGRGGGGFVAVEATFPARLATGPTGDFNADGIPDLLATAVDQGFTLQTILGGGFQGQGDASFGFGPASQNITSAFRTGLALGDIDNNGSLDFFAAAEGSIEVHAYTPPLFQRSELLIPSGSGFVRVPTVADLDRDRFADLVLARADGTAELYRSTGSPLFFAPSDPPRSDLLFRDVAEGTHRSDATVAADLNGDGRLDLASLDVASGHVRFLLGDAAGNLVISPLAPAVDLGLSGAPNTGGGDPAVLLVVDLDGDHFPDLAGVIGNQGSEVAYAFGMRATPGGAAFLASVRRSVPSGVLREVHAADIDANGLLDLVLVTDNQTYLLLQTAPRAFATDLIPIGIPARPGFADTTATILDFNGDTIPDLVASSDGGIRFWQGTGEVISFPTTPD